MHMDVTNILQMSTSCSVGLSDSSSINLKRFFIIDGYRTVLLERCAVAV